MSIISVFASFYNCNFVAVFASFYKMTTKFANSSNGKKILQIFKNLEIKDKSTFFKFVRYQNLESYENLYLAVIYINFDEFERKDYENFGVNVYEIECEINKLRITQADISANVKSTCINRIIMTPVNYLRKCYIRNISL